MQYIFTVLFGAHPVAPLLFFALMVNGLIAPALYTWRNQMPYDIAAIRAHARAGRRLAKYVYFSWLAFAIVAGIFVALAVVAMIMK